MQERGVGPGKAEMKRWKGMRRIRDRGAVGNCAANGVVDFSFYGSALVWAEREREGERKKERRKVGGTEGKRGGRGRALTIKSQWKNLLESETKARKIVMYRASSLMKIISCVYYTITKLKWKKQGSLAKWRTIRHKMKWESGRSEKKTRKCTRVAGHVMKASNFAQYLTLARASTWKWRLYSFLYFPYIY